MIRLNNTKFRDIRQAKEAIERVLDDFYIPGYPEVKAQIMQFRNCDIRIDYDREKYQYFMVLSVNEFAQILVNRDKRHETN